MIKIRHRVVRRLEMQRMAASATRKTLSGKASRGAM
jgi:hypothetical protein